mmetsp:Transcript_27547/g.53526  ORF Transcript_27547/g.53526 Transcript_27547/m.53526 type:complete len:107 (+) Transcript_27547:388-708(+)
MSRLASRQEGDSAPQLESPLSTGNITCRIVCASCRPCKVGFLLIRESLKSVSDVTTEQTRVHWRLLRKLLQKVGIYVGHISLALFRMWRLKRRLDLQFHQLLEIDA